LIALLCYGGLLLVVLRHGLRGNRVNQVFSLYLLSMWLWQLAYLMVTLSGSAEMALLWYKVVVAVVSGQFILYFVFTSAFLRSPVSNTLIYAGLGIWAVSVLWVLGGREPSFYTGVRRDPGTGLFVPSFGPLLPVLAAPNYLFLAYAVFNLLRGYRTTKSPLQRSRIQYLLLGIALVVVGTVANLVPSIQAYPIDVVANIVHAFCIAYAIYRYQLLNIRLAVRKGLLYSIPSAIIGFVYFLVAFAAVGLFHLVAGFQLVLSFVLGAATAALVEPLRSRVQSWVDRVFFREQYDSRAMLQALSAKSAAVLDQDELTGMILDAVVDTLHVERAVFLLRDEGSGELRLTAQRGLAEGKQINWLGDHPVVQWLMEGPDVLSRRELETAPRFRSLWGQELEELELLQPDLFIPLWSKGELLGIFVLGAKRSQEPYSVADRVTLTTLANQAAVAVANARLYTAEQRRASESQVLLDIAAAVSSTLDLQKVLELIARRTAGACQVHRCSIFLLDDDQARILPLMSQFVSGASDRNLWERFRHQTYLEKVEDVPILRTVIQKRQPLLLRESELDALPASWVAPYGICTLLVVPLVARGRVIGAMALDHVVSGRSLSAEQVNLAMTIGSQTAAAIANARLYDQAIQEKARAEAVLQGTFSGFVLVDQNHSIQAMNPAAESITGYRREEVLGRAVDQVLGQEMAEPSGPLMRVWQSGEPTAPQEVSLEVKSGRKDVLLAVTPLPGGDQSSGSVLISFTDISRLKEIDRLKSSIVANVSHELRTPLASIKAYAELLLSGADAADAKLRQAWLAVIDQETDRVTALINDMLNLARLEAERVSLVKRAFDLGELIGGVAALLRVQAQQRGITLLVDVQPDLPPILADRGLLETVVKNLVDNAIKFSHEDGMVRISASETGSEHTIVVEDEGVGIPADALPQLFSKFFRVPSTDAAAVQGTGLGLALVKEAVAAHGGRVHVESKVGKGSRFTVSLPTARPSTKPSAPGQ